MRHQRFLRYVDEVARAGSIRKAADILHVTPSALNRRIMDLEEEIGAPIFERHSRGVHLTSSGEIFVHSLRQQLADSQRMLSQIEDLKGLRRGHVRIACSQALAHGLMPEVITHFRRSYPLVTFNVLALDHERAMQALEAYEVDLIAVFKPMLSRNFSRLLTIKQRLVALVAKSHPLARARSVRLSDCVAYPLALPGHSLGGRQLLDEAFARARLTVTPAIESNSFEFLMGCVAASGAISFQIEVGSHPIYLAGMGVAPVPINNRDVPSADLVLGQFRERSLPVAVAKFCEELADSLRKMRFPAPSG